MAPLVWLAVSLALAGLIALTLFMRRGSHERNRLNSIATALRHRGVTLDVPTGPARAESFAPFACLVEVDPDLYRSLDAGLVWSAAGTQRRVGIRVIEHRYEADDGTRIVHVAAGIDCPASWPRLAIGPRTNGSGQEAEDQIRTGDSSFDAERVVWCDDHAFGQRLLSIRVREALAATSATDHWRIEDGQLTVVRRTQGDPGSNEVLGILAKVVRLRARFIRAIEGQATRRSHQRG